MTLNTNFFSLKGKNALVTGATGGIGFSIAKTLHAAGAKVVLSGTRETILEENCKLIGDGCSFLTANLNDSESTSQLFKKAEEILGQIDILVCNAGVTKDNLLIRMSEEEFDEVIRVNLKSAFILNREAVKSMSKRRNGRIINISSVVALSGNFGQANYTASKAGLIGMTKSVALECASRGITANCIAPGFIVTPMTDVIRDDIKDKIKEKIPMKEFGAPEDIANAALYLASEESRYVTGAVINVNGGMYLA